MVICIACRAHLDARPHELGCTMTRRIASDEKLAEVLLRRGLV